MSAHFKVASQTASRVAYNPYRNAFRKEILLTPPTFKTQVINLIHKIVKALFVWKKPTSNRNIRRVVRKVSSTQARNKADPHLVKRV